MRCLASLILLCAQPVLAEGWQPLGTGEIEAALAARALQYEDGATQNFFSDGRTLYRAGAGESWGKWWVEGDLYCSTWPPSETPSCYRVEGRGLDIRFVGSSGEVTVGRHLDH